MTPSRQGPVSATGGFAADLALGAAFFVTGLAGVAAAGVLDGAGDWAHQAAVRHDTRMVAAAKLRNMA